MQRWTPSASASSTGSRRYTHSSSSRSSTNNLSSYSSSSVSSVGMRGSVFSSSSETTAASSSSLAGNNNNTNNSNIHNGQQQTGDSEFWECIDYGAVNVNEDTRRKIRADIEDIDASIQQTQIGIQQEERTADQLNKDSSHAGSEMLDFNTKSYELKESSTMNKRILVDLEKTLKTDLLEPLSDNNLSKSSSSNNNSGNNDKGGGGKEGDNGIETTKKFLQRSYQKADSVFRCEENKVFAEAMADCDILQQELASIHKRVQTENLHPLLDQKKGEANARRRDLEAETARKQTVEAAIQQSRMQCGGFAQDITDKRKTLLDMKKQHEAKLAELRQDLEASQAELQGVKSKEQWELELAAVEKQRDAAIKTIADAKAMIEKRKSLGMDCEAMQIALQELQGTEQNMSAKVIDLKERVEQAKTKLESAKKEEAEVETIKIENDQFEAEKVLPAKSELVDVLKEKEQLAQCINEAHEALKTHTEQVTAAGQEGNKEVHRLEVQISETQMQLTEKATEMGKLQSSKDESDQTQAEEAEKLKGCIDKVNKAAKSEQDHADELARAVKSKIQKAEIAKEEAEHNRKDRERYREVLDTGVTLLDATATKVKEIKESIETDSDEEDLSDSSLN